MNTSILTASIVVASLWASQLGGCTASSEPPPDAGADADTCELPCAYVVNEVRNHLRASGCTEADLGCPIDELDFYNPVCVDGTDLPCAEYDQVLSGFGCGTFFLSCPEAP